jgi:hypothetical protein
LTRSRPLKTPWRKRLKNLEEITDLVELRVWATESPFTVSSLKEEFEASSVRIDRASFYEQADDIYDYSERQNGDEAEVGGEDEALGPGARARRSKEDSLQLAELVLEEVRKRKQILGAAYPFSAAGEGVILSSADPEHLSYLFCLVLSYINDIPDQMRSPQFENVAGFAGASFLNGEFIRLGAPWNVPGVASYEDLLNHVSKIIKEVGRPRRKKAPGGGDGGWDLLVVKNSADNRFTRIILLGNAATGRTNWMKKGTDAEPTLLWSFFQSKPSSPVLRFFAVPFIMDHGDRLRKGGEATLIFDRYRIAEFAPSVDDEVADWLASEKQQAGELPIL